ncbi:MAG: hypothetical protein ABFE08_18155, partial [Armatimonadia bacterium]
QLARLSKRLGELEKDKQRAEGKLANEKFVANAKPEIVEQERARLVTIEEQIGVVKEQVALFEGLV